jgi:hypothetical protein
LNGGDYAGAAAEIPAQNKAVPQPVDTEMRFSAMV